MNRKALDESELAEILQIAQDGEFQLRQMSDYASIMAEKWRMKIHPSGISASPKDPKIHTIKDT